MHRQLAMHILPASKPEAQPLESFIEPGDFLTRIYYFGRFGHSISRKIRSPDGHENFENATRETPGGGWATL
jgi:hypothetical protein